MPHTFKTTDNKTHTLAFTIGTLRRLRDCADLRERAGVAIDLLRFGSDEKASILTTLQADAVLTCEVIAYALQIPDEDAFLASLDGAATQAALDAFWGELSDFFRQSGATLQHMAVQRMREIVGKAQALAAESIGQTLTDKALAELTTILANSPTASPESSASTPNP